MVRHLACYAEGRPDHWEAFCLDLDIAVTGASFGEVYATLNTAIATYIEDARKEAPEQAARLLNRRVPWIARLKLVLKVAWHWLWTPSRADGDSASFTLACPA